VPIVARAINGPAVHNAAGMATPKPGEIRCPTCHRSTPPAAFCTQCGSAIPADARIRPRGMDRDELQDRIRARRSGGDPYRRGSESEEGTGIYERFEPDPTDAMARQSRPPDEQRRDLFDERAAAAAAPPPSPPAPADPPRSLVRDPDEWTSPAPTPPSAAPEPEWGEPAPPPPDAPVDNFDDVAYGDAGYEPAYDYEAWEEPQRSSNSLLPILGFLGLGVLALVAGAVIANMMGSSGIGASSPSPTVSVAPSVEATTVPTAVPSDTAAPSGSPGASGGPIVFPDGFTAEAQPCLPGSAGGSGCDSNGVSNGGSVDIWVGFENGNRNDVVGAILEAPDGSIVDDATIDLARIGCGQSCNGWTRFSFANLPPGTYEVRITRNGEPASSTTFEVS
jgi:hypothetical protein